MKYFKATWSFTLIPSWYCLGRGQKMDALGTSLPRKHQKTCLHVQGSESWESNSLPESCVGPSLPVVPGILANHFILTLLPISVDTLNLGDRVIMVCCCDDDDVMRALRLKEDRHPRLTSPLTLLLCQFLCLPVSASVCRPLSLCLCLYIFVCLCLTLVCLSLLISQFLSMDFVLNAFSVSPLFLITPHLWDLSFPARIKPMAPALKAPSPNRWGHQVSLCLFLSPWLPYPTPTTPSFLLVLPFC